MPNIKSAKKRVKVSAAKTAHNKSARSALKTEVKKANLAAAADAPDKQETVRQAVKKLDQAAAKGILHKNTAARRKSQLAKALNAAPTVVEAPIPKRAKKTETAEAKPAAKKPAATKVPAAEKPAAKPVTKKTAEAKPAAKKTETKAAAKPAAKKTAPAKKPAAAKKADKDE